MKVNKTKYYIKYLIFIALTCLFALLSAFFSEKVDSRKKLVELEYREESSVDYNIYLDKNDFYDNEYLTKNNIEKENKKAVSNIVNKIDLCFEYILQFESRSSGNYSYYINAVIEANEAGNESSNYWSKEYNLVNEKNIEYKDFSKLDIKSKVSVDYKEYEKILSDYKKLINKEIDGKLTVYLVVESEVQNEKLINTYTVNSKTLFTTPLLKDSLDITTKCNDSDIIKTFSEKLKVDESKNSEFKLLVVLFACLSIVSSFGILATIYKYRKENYYYVRLKKILGDYDNIIVNVYSIPDMKKYNVIKVKTFNELLDAQSEVREPINCYQKKKSTDFLLYHDNIVWVYTMLNHKD